MIFSHGLPVWSRPRGRCNLYLDTATFRWLYGCPVCHAPSFKDVFNSRAELPGIGIYNKVLLLNADGEVV